MKIGLFLLSLCFSLSFFIPSSSSSHSAINPNSHLSDQREGWSFSLLTHLQFVCRRDVPVNRDQRAWSDPLGLLQPCLPACWPLLLSVWAGRQAGRTRDGWAGPLPCMFLLLESLMHHVSACPLSQASLLEWLLRHGAWHEIALHLCIEPGQLTVPGGIQEWSGKAMVRGSCKGYII
jgi:hypothetical protein